LSFALFERERAAGRALVAAFVVATEGSTYRKPGAWMCIARDGERDGLLSGGCLEADLAERALRLLDRGGAIELAAYDSRTSDDPVWGLGLGCEGLMRIALLQVGPASDWQPLAALRRAELQAGPVAIAVALTRDRGDLPAGTVVTVDATGARARRPDGPCPPSAAATLEAAARRRLERGGAECADGVFAMAAPIPPAVLVCGAGPDAEPLVDWGARLGWHVTVADHREAYLRDGARRFALAHQVLAVEPGAPGAGIALDAFSAAVVMSHHLEADARYLAALAASRVPYVGLLGPAARRERLLAGLDAALAARLAPRLRAPVGLDLGGGTPESIALSVVAEIQAALHGRDARPFSAAR
jgi:xanthine/CO dehydrogenase XdhC/CoxF family maturation factor